MERMLERSGAEIVRKLSDKFGFDEDEGMAEVNLCGVKVEVEKKKEVKGSKEKSKIPLPFCGEMREENCRGVRLNHGLYTQCTNKHDEEDSNGELLCGTCNKQSTKNSNNKPTYGYIGERMEAGEKYLDPKGKPAVLYGNVMEKLNISRAEAEKEAENQGLTIPEEQFEVKKAQRGRPKKSVVAIDTSGSDEEEVKKPRGRPKKEKKETTHAVGDDVIKNLVNNTNDKKKKSEPVEHPSPPKIVAKYPPKEDSSDEEEEDEDDLEVSKIDIQGKTYLKSSDNTLFDLDSHEEIGMWNPKTKKIEANTDDD